MKKTQSRLGKRLLFRTGISAILFIILILVSLYYLVSQVKQNETNQKVIDEIDENFTDLYIAVIDQETGQRGFNLTRNEEFLAPFYSGIDVFNMKEDALLQLLVNYPELTKYVLDTIEKGKLWTNEFGIPQIQIGLANQKLDELSLNKGKIAFDSFRKSYEISHNLIEKESNRAQQAFINKIIIIFLGSSLLFIITFTFLWYVISRKFSSITKPIILLSECVKDYTSNIFVKEPPKYNNNDEIAELIMLKFTQEEFKKEAKRLFHIDA